MSSSDVDAETIEIPDKKLKKMAKAEQRYQKQVQPSKNQRQLNRYGKKLKQRVLEKFSKYKEKFSNIAGFSIESSTTVDTAIIKSIDKEIEDNDYAVINLKHSETNEEIQIKTEWSNNAMEDNELNNLFDYHNIERGDFLDLIGQKTPVIRTENDDWRLHIPFEQNLISLFIYRLIRTCIKTNLIIVDDKDLNHKFNNSIHKLFSNVKYKIVKFFVLGLIFHWSLYGSATMHAAVTHDLGTMTQERKVRMISESYPLSDFSANSPEHGFAILGTFLFLSEISLLVVYIVTKVKESRLFFKLKRKTLRTLWPFKNG